MLGRELAGSEATTARAVAFRRLAEAHLTSSYRLARAILGDPTEAQDATHDAFVTAWRHWAQLRDESRFERWFDRIVVNTCRNRLRRASRWSVREITAELPVSVGDPIAEAESRAVIGAAFRQLPADDRVVLALRYYRDLTVDEIAQRLEIPVGTVKSRLHHAQRRLEAALHASDEGPSHD